MTDTVVLLYAAHCITGCCCSMLSGRLHDRYCCMPLIVLLVVVQCYLEDYMTDTVVLLYAAHCVTGCCCSMLSGGLHDRYCCMPLIVLLVVVVQCHLEDYMTDTVVCRSLCYWLLLFNVIWRTT